MPNYTKEDLEKAAALRNYIQGKPTLEEKIRALFPLVTMSGNPKLYGICPAEGEMIDHMIKEIFAPVKKVGENKIEFDKEGCKKAFECLAKINVENKVKLGEEILLTATNWELEMQGTEQNTPEQRTKNAQKARIYSKLSPYDMYGLTDGQFLIGFEESKYNGEGLKAFSEDKKMNDFLTIGILKKYAKAAQKDMNAVIPTKEELKNELDAQKAEYFNNCQEYYRFKVFEACKDLNHDDRECYKTGKLPIFDASDNKLKSKYEYDDIALINASNVARARELGHQPIPWRSEKEQKEFAIRSYSELPPTDTPQEFMQKVENVRLVYRKMQEKMGSVFYDNEEYQTMKESLEKLEEEMNRYTENGTIDPMKKIANSKERPYKLEKAMKNVLSAGCGYAASHVEYRKSPNGRRRFNAAMAIIRIASPDAAMAVKEEVSAQRGTEKESQKVDFQKIEEYFDLKNLQEPKGWKLLQERDRIVNSAELKLIRKDTLGLKNVKKADKAPVKNDEKKPVENPKKMSKFSKLMAPIAEKQELDDHVTKVKADVAKAADEMGVKDVHNKLEETSMEQLYEAEEIKF